MLHVDQELQPDTMQSTGHCCALHERVSFKCGQGAPLHAVITVMIRLRVCAPTPQDFVQALHGLNGATRQSTVQQWVLHASVSALCGHASPPCFGATTVRHLNRVPPAQCLVHAVQFAHEPTTQSCGHGCALQPRASSRLGQA